MPTHQTQKCIHSGPLLLPISSAYLDMRQVLDVALTQLLSVRYAVD